MKKEEGPKGYKGATRKIPQPDEIIPVPTDTVLIVIVIPKNQKALKQ